jgi:hypothetical protein
MELSPSTSSGKFNSKQSLLSGTTIGRKILGIRRDVGNAPHIHATIDLLADWDAVFFQYCYKILQILACNSRRLLRRMHYHPDLVVVVVWKPNISILISIDKSNYCSCSWQVILLGRVSSLIQFGYLESTGHAEPHIIEKIDPNRIRVRAWSSCLKFFELVCLRIETSYLCSVIFREPQLASAVYCNPPRPAIVGWCWVFSYFTSLCMYFTYPVTS